jgi:hypothetical protein
VLGRVAVADFFVVAVCARAKTDIVMRTAIKRTSGIFIGRSFAS